MGGAEKAAGGSRHILPDCQKFGRERQRGKSGLITALTPRQMHSLIPLIAAFAEKLESHATPVAIRKSSTEKTVTAFLRQNTLPISGMLIYATPTGNVRDRAVNLTP